MIRSSCDLPIVPGTTVSSTVPAGIAYERLAHAGGFGDTEPFRITTYVLQNGLQVILVEDHSAPTVATSVWYRVGGAHDPSGRSGFAHLFEHMMFQGSANVPRGKHAESISAAGGNHNASTSTDRTNYFEELPAHQLPLALWLEADRMSSLVVDAVNFQREREVVKEEYHQRVENQPYGEAVLMLETIAYDYPPYQTAVIGSIEDLDRSTVEEVRQFHEVYYLPNNATLTVAGDIDPEQTRELIERYFGSIPGRRASPDLPSYSFTPQEGPGEFTVNDQLARVPATLAVHRIPPRSEADYYAVELLSHILGSGNSSRLARSLVDTGLATVASSSVVGNVGPGMFYAVLIPNQGVEVGRLAQIFFDEVNSIRKDGVDEDELIKATNGILTRQVGGLQDSLGLAESVQFANFYLGDPQAVFADLESYRAVTAEDVRRVAGDYLDDHSRNVINVVLPDGQASDGGYRSPVGSETAPGGQPEEAVSEPDNRAEAADLTGAGVATEDADRFDPPDPLPVHEFNLPEIVERELDNGLRVIVAPERSLPYLTVQLVLPGGESTTPSGLSGLAGFTVDLLPRGTETHTAQEIASMVEQAGGDLSTAANHDLVKASVTILSSHIALAFEILGDVVLHPSFPQEEIDIERQRALTNLQVALANPAEVGHRAFNSIVYGSHPYGRNPTEQSLNAIARDDLLDFYSANLDPKAAMLIVAGDISPEDAVERARATFGDWSSDAPLERVDYPAPPHRQERVVYLVDRPGSSQVEVVIGHPGLQGASRYRHAAQVANEVLGAGPTSRLFLNLREEKGYTYGVYSGFSLPRGIGKFLVQAAVRNDIVEPAIREILTEMERLRETAVPDRELLDAKSYLTGSFALRLETVRDLASQLISLKIRGLPLGALRLYPKAIDAVDERGVTEVAEKYILPDTAAIVVVGAAREIRDTLEKIAPVVLIDSEGQAVEAQRP